MALIVATAGFNPWISSTASRRVETPPARDLFFAPGNSLIFREGGGLFLYEMV
jgi:hypothetical protein